VLIAVTDHAVKRYRQRVAGSLDARQEIVARVARALDAGRVEEGGRRGTLHVRDTVDRSLVFVCRQGDGELVVITLWERDGGVAEPRVPRRFTDALEPRRRRRRGGDPPPG
jgi:hypothetical protein